MSIKHQPNTVCAVCGKPIYRIPSRLNGQNTCSISCRNKFFSGKRSFVWKGGKPNISKTRQKEKELRLRNKQKAVALKGGQCCRCGYSTCLGSLQFHHIDPSVKEFNICCMEKWERLEKELAKCVLLCSNCHDELHWSQNHAPETYKEITAIISATIQRLPQS